MFITTQKINQKEMILVTSTLLPQTYSSIEQESYLGV